jgi:hypothetical protein
LYVKAGTAAEDVDEGWSWANAPPESNKVVSNVNGFIFKEKKTAVKHVQEAEKPTL